MRLGTIRKRYNKFRKTRRGGKPPGNKGGPAALAQTSNAAGQVVAPTQTQNTTGGPATVAQQAPPSNAAGQVVAPTQTQNTRGGPAALAQTSNAAGQPIATPTSSNAAGQLVVPLPHLKDIAVTSNTARNPSVNGRVVPDGYYRIIGDTKKHNQSYKVLGLPPAFAHYANDVEYVMYIWFKILEQTTNPRFTLEQEYATAVAEILVNTPLDRNNPVPVGYLPPAGSGITLNPNFQVFFQKQVNPDGTIAQVFIVVKDRTKPSSNFQNELFHLTIPVKLAYDERIHVAFLDPINPKKGKKTYTAFYWWNYSLIRTKRYPYRSKSGGTRRRRLLKQKRTRRVVRRLIGF